MIDQELSVASCPVCGGSLNSVSEEREVRIGRRSAQVVDESGRCADCGETFYAPDQMNETLRRASDAIREEEGLLSSEAVRGIREKLGLTQQAFEELLGVGPKTVVRWEKGTVFQNRSTDSLLRVIDALPESARFLARLHGVPLRDHPEVAVQ